MIEWKEVRRKAKEYEIALEYKVTEIAIVDRRYRDNMCKKCKFLKDLSCIKKRKPSDCARKGLRNKE